MCFTRKPFHQKAMSKSGESEKIQKISARIRSILPGYLAKQAAQVERVDALLKKGEFEEILRIGHAINGTGSGYGLPELGNLGAAMEEAAELRDAAAINQHEKELRLMLELLQTTRALIG